MTNVRAKVDRLCVVDDDEIFQFLAKRIITQASLAECIKIFSNGQEAIDFLKEAKNNKEKLPDVILLDLSMPVMDGWEFLEEYIMLEPKLDKEITIYIVSSSVNPKDIERAKSINQISDYIVKPITKEKLVSLLKNL